METIEDFRILSQKYPMATLDPVQDIRDRVPPCLNPDVVILTRRADRESGFLVDSLLGCGVAVRRVDIDSPPRVEILVDPSGERLSIDDEVVDPKVVLYRYFSPNAVGADENLIFREFARKEWRAFNETLVGVLKDKLLNPGAALGTIDCATQMSAARRAGFVVPRTRISNYLTVLPSPALLKAVSSHEIEVDAGCIHIVRPLDVERATVDPTVLQQAPVVHQEKIRTSLPEIRVYVIRENIVAYAVNQWGGRDRWMQSADVEVRPFELTREQHDKFINLSTACQLDLCAVDAFVVGDDIAFVEVNPVFNWMWYEVRARRHNVSLLIVKAIIEKLQASA